MASFYEVVHLLTPLVQQHPHKMQGRAAVRVAPHPHSLHANVEQLHREQLALAPDSVRHMFRMMRNDALVRAKQKQTE